MYTEKILEIVNARCKNAGKRQSMLKNAWKSSMYAEKILENVNVHRKNAQNRQCKGVRMLGNGNVRRKNARNPQCTQKKSSESVLCAERTLGNTNTCKRMLGIGNVYTERTLGIHKKGREYAWNRQYTQRGDLES